MQEWEQEIFQREYSDMTWIKGKQSKYSQPTQSTNSTVGRSYLYPSSVPTHFHPPVMTPSQRMIFDQVNAFVLENRSMPSSELRDAELSMPNAFSAGERAFLAKLAQDLHLTLSWDEYDDEDQNLVVLRFPGVLESPLDDEDSESDSQDEAEAIAAVDRVLRKYDKAETMENDEANFDSREELRLKQKMDEWKRTYYLV
jgi:5'-3' exoribonuclease 1